MNRLLPAFSLPSRICLLLSLLLLTSCKPVITFTGQSLVNAQGNEFGRLTWTVQGEESDQFQLTGVTIEPGIGAVEASGSLAVYPTQTTTYTLTAFASGPNNTIYNTVKKATIYVGPRVNYSQVQDAQLRACLQDTGFTHLEQFDVMYCLDRNIRSLAGLQQFSQTRSVSLDNNAITNLAPLAQMRALHTLSISNNALATLDGLAASNSIRTIVAFNNRLTDVSALAAMPQLLNLALDSNQLQDASPLASLQQLQSLSLARNQIANVAPLGALTGLLALDISHNGVNAGVTSLRTLTKASAIRSSGNGGVRCIDYANLLLALGPVVIFDNCKLF